MLLKNGKNIKINLSEMFKVNQIIRSRVIEISKEKNIIDISIRHLKHPNDIESPLVYNDVIKGELLSGVVTMVDERIGVIVWLSRYIKGRISFRHLNIKNVSYNKAVNKFPIGTIINNVSVLFVSAATKRVELSITDSRKTNSGKMKKNSHS